eukprot:scaffold155445_cov31-Tisochrysis_lutea.AAC.2
MISLRPRLVPKWAIERGRKYCGFAACRRAWLSEAPRGGHANTGLRFVGDDNREQDTRFV